MAQYRWSCSQTWCNWEYISQDTDEWEIDEAMKRRVKCQQCGMFIIDRPKIVDPA